MTARNKQVALTKPDAPSLNPKIPQFLQKLYTMVSDPRSDEVICWSDSGESFFVLDQVRLEKECLGDWFKHNKFASFVRQLNMYGFHKIPHLQQGALRSTSATEYSQFQHPDFRRGQEDRLMFIERKKQITPAKDQGVVDFPAVTQQPATQLQTDPSTGQALDIHAIVTGIAAIRRHQANISNELNELKRSNQLLWQESMEARSRHQKQQDMINRIVKFLAGVFGQHASSSAAKEKEGDVPSPVVRNLRLMIEDKKRENVPKVGIIEVQDEDAASPIISRAQSPHPYPSIETPGSSSYPSPGVTEISTHSAVTPHLDLTSPHSEFPSSSSPNANNSVVSTQPRYSGSEIGQENHLPTFSPPRSPTIDERLQAALSYLTPGDIQQLFTSLNNHVTSLPSEVDLSSLQQGAQQNQLTSSPIAPLNFGSLSPSLQLPQLPSQSNSGLSEADGLISFDGPLMEQWKQASDIEQEVNEMNTGIDSLIHELGLDPSAIASTEANQANAGEADVSVLDPSVLPSSGIPVSDSVAHDELFNSFLSTFPSPGTLTMDSNATDLGGGTGTGFESNGMLDLSSINPVATQLDKIASPLTIIDNPSTNNTRTHKRKSDSGMEMKLQLSSNPKAKRRKDK